MEGEPIEDLICELRQVREYVKVLRNGLEAGITGWASVRGGPIAALASDSFRPPIFAGSSGT